ncbi:DUF3099 domain-containing protein [Nocardioides sp.]|uniref:DUF3099 domain-containing protein n=1 Tax=Nocardioides sp. TaxID=35761 RepID=UPI002ED579A7
MTRQRVAHGRAVRITTAPLSRQEEIAQRQRRYVLSMSLRTVCFVGAVVADGWLRWVLVAGAVVLPYVAVVMANAVSSKSDGFALRRDPEPRNELPNPTDSEGSDR